MNINEVAEKLGIHTQTLRRWEKEIPILDIKRDSKGHRFYSDSDVDILQKILALQAEGKDFKRILSILSSTYDKVDVNLNSACNQVEYNLSTSLVVQLKEEIKSVIVENTELAEKYARATYTIGQQEEKIKSLEEKIHFLPAPDEFAKITTQNEMLKEEKERLLVTINEFDKVKEENITIKQKLSLFPEPEVFHQIKQKNEHLANENLILQRQVQKLLDEVEIANRPWWEKLWAKMNNNKKKMVVHKVNIEAMT